MLGSVKNRRVLIVDDELAIADSLTQIFINAGYSARAAYDAESALALVPEFAPELAIIDVFLPGMNGIDLAIRLRADYPECRLSLFSGASGSSDLLQEALRNGHEFRILPKPIHPLELLGVVSEMLLEGSGVVGHA